MTNMAAGTVSTPQNTETRWSKITVVLSICTKPKKKSRFPAVCKAIRRRTSKLVRQARNFRRDWILTFDTVDWTEDAEVECEQCHGGKQKLNSEHCLDGFQAPPEMDLKKHFKTDLHAGTTELRSERSG